MHGGDVHGPYTLRDREARALGGRNHGSPEARPPVARDALHLEEDVAGPRGLERRRRRVGALERAAVRPEGLREGAVQAAAERGVLVVDGAVGGEGEGAAALRGADLEEERGETGGEDARRALHDRRDHLLQLHTTRLSLTSRGPQDSHEKEEQI